MAAINWKSGVDGDWSTAGDWSSGTVPGAGDAATIAASGTYDVTIDDAEAAGSLSIDDAGATVEDNATFTLGGALTVKAGVFGLNGGGEIVGGTLTAAGGAFAWNGGTLDGVTYDGPLNLTTATSALNIVGGLTATGVNGAGAGTINLTGGAAGSILGAEMDVQGGETLDDATLNIGNANSIDSFLMADPTGATPVLTLGAQFNIVQAGALATIDDANNFAADSLVNDGSISAGVSGGLMTINPVNFTNDGTITVSNDDDVFLDPVSFTEATGHTITVASGGELDLGFDLTTAQMLAEFTNTSGKIGIGGALDNSTTTLTVGSGTSEPTVVLGVNATGTPSGSIISGTIVDEGSGMAFAGGALSGVTYRGTMDLSEAGSAVSVNGGLTLESGPTGTGAGKVLLTGVGSMFTFAGDETLDDATIDIGSTGAGATLEFSDPEDATPDFTLGSQLSIVQTGAVAILSGFGFSTDAVTNDGAITAGVTGGAFELFTFGTFTNNGQIGVSNGDSLYLGEPGYLTSFVQGAAGSVTVAKSATLNLGFDLNTGQLESEFTDNGGDIGVGGTLTNTGAFLSVGSGGAVPTMTLGVNYNLAMNNLGVAGTILGGTIADFGSGMVFNGGTLSGVAYEGAMNLSNGGASVYVTGGLTATGANGNGQGAINLTGAGAALYAAGGESLDDLTLTMGPGAIFDLDDPNGDTAVLTLGAHFDIHQTGATATIGDDATVNTGDSIIDDGAITASVKGGVFTIDVPNFTNNGSIAVGNGDTLDLEPGTLTNLAGTTLTGGSFEAEAGSTLQFQNATITTDAATIVVSGAGSVIESLDTSNSSKATIESTLTAIAEFGDLKILGGRNWTTTNTIANAGTVSLGGGTLTAADFDNSGLANGYGAIAATLTNSGVIAVGAAETLALPGDLTNLSGTTLTGGTFDIGAGGTLQLANNASIGTLDATIELGGAGSNVQALNTSTSKQVNLASTLKAIGAKGSLELLSGDSYTTTSSIANSGQILLGGGTLTTSGLTVAAGATVSGFGLVAATTTNSGLISVQAAKTLSLVGGALTNLSGTTLTGGTYSVGAGAVLQLADNVAIDTLDATIDLAGAGAKVQSLNTTKSAQVGLEATLTAIGATGVLQTLDGRGYATSNAISNAGVLRLGGGTFSSGRLTGSASSTLTGFGTIASVVSDAGAVSASVGTLAFTAAGNTFAGALSGAVTFNGGADAMNAGASIGAGVWSISGGASVAVNGNVADAGAMRQAASTTLTIGSGDALSLSATGSTLAGAIDGSGALNFTGGTQALNAGASLGVAKWTISGGVASLGEALTYAGAFSQSGGTLKSGAFALTLNGPATFAPGAAVTGGGSMALHGATTISGLGVGGSEALTNSATVTQTGQITLGDTTTAAAKLTNAAGAVFNVAGNVGIARGASAGSLFTNAGTLAKTAGTGVSLIGVDVTNTGTLSVAAGTLELTGPVNSLSGVASGAGTLAFGGGATTLSAGLALSVANLSVLGAATVLTLASSRAYAGNFSQSGGTVNTAAFGLTLSGPASFGPSATIIGGGTVALQGAATINGLTVGRTESVTNASTVTQTGELTIGDASTSAARFTNAAGAVFDIAANTGIGKGAAAGSSFTNAGTLAKTAGTGVSLVALDFTSTGTVGAATGTLQFSGESNNVAGAIDGPGSVTFSAGTTNLGTVTLAGGVTLTDAGQINQAGLVTVTNATIDNGLTWDLTSNNGIVLAAGGSGSFSNNGVLDKTEGAGVVHIAIDVVDTDEGTLEADAGTLELDGAANTVAGFVSGSGTVALGVGVSSVENLQLSGGGKLTNAGTVNQSGVVTAVNEAIANAHGAVWNLTSDNGVQPGYGVLAFTNAGTLAKTAGTGVSTIGVDVTDTGSVSVASGTLSFAGAVNSFTGTMSGAGTIDFAGGADTLTAAHLSAADVSIDSAAVTFSGVTFISGALSATSSSLTVASAGATLSGGGTFALSDLASSAFEGATSGATLTNYDDKLVGAGDVGSGQMTLVNDAGAVIDGDDAVGLTLDTGANTIVNAGLIEDTGAGGVTVQSAVDNTGVLSDVAGDLTVNGAVTGSGSAKIGTGTLFFASTFDQDVTFTGGSTGTLELSDSQGYHGTISGFSLTGATTLDLNDISYGIFDSATYVGTATGGTLTVTDGTDTASIHLSGDYLDSTFELNPDGHFGLLVTDPAKPGAPATGTAGQPHFVAAMAGLAPTPSAPTHDPQARAGPAYPVLAAPVWRQASGSWR